MNSLNLLIVFPAIKFKNRKQKWNLMNYIKMNFKSKTKYGMVTVE